MESQQRVTLHGFWSSAYSKRVELALKVKGVQYEYVEEDLVNKSPLLLQYNPVHKKIPVLVHNGIPIAESIIILEYIEETWKEGPPLMPKDPYERAKVRFWVSFLEHQVFQTLFRVVTSEGEAQDKAIKEVHEKLKMLEEGIQTDFPRLPLFFNGENMGVLDMVMCSIFGIGEVHKDVLGVNFMDQERYPLVSSWVVAMTELPLVKEATPPSEKLSDFLRLIRKKALKSAVA